MAYRFPVALLALVTVFAAFPVSASPVTFTIDSTQSQISLAIELTDGTPISTAQSPGSDTTTLFGTAQVDISPTSIQFFASGNGQFALQPEPQSPLADGTSGSAPAQYGLTIDIPGIGGGAGAVRQLVGDVTSSSLPLTGDSFDSTQLAMQFLTGSIAYNLNLLGTPVVGSADITFPVTNQASGGTLTVVGGQYVINIPILAVGEGDVDGITLLGVYTGQIVATAPVPEPTTAALVVAACCTWGVWRLRRDRRSEMQ
ncbi:MAG TPA: PEP-CTERM sorting domain-containing protein [Pirellulales bacterium]|jgi:hypothetical protein